MKVAVNVWNQRRIKAMIHDVNCHWVKLDWRRFASLEEAEAHYGELAFTGRCCLPSSGNQYDRSQ